MNDTSETPATTLQNVRARHAKFETFRTPDYSYKPLFDYRPEWFEGIGFDPSAGDGRMLAEVMKRGNAGPHHLNDIREEERPALELIGHTTIGDYLKMEPPVVDFMITNPPFTKSVDFVVKARTHVKGPICILQSISWQGTQKRSDWLRKSGLAYVLNLPVRPKWEVDGAASAPSNIWDFAWFVFLPDYKELPRMDWLGPRLDWL